MKTSIIVDVETTGLIKFETAPLEQLPRIIEIGAIKINSGLTELDTFQCYVNPKMPLPDIIKKITGISEQDILQAATFPQILPDLAEFFVGTTEFIAHNAQFDHNCLRIELQRIGREFQFPWPPEIIDTAETSVADSTEGKYLKLGDWYELVTGSKLEVAHRALDDCQTLLTILQART